MQPAYRRGLAEFLKAALLAALLFVLGTAAHADDAKALKGMALVIGQSKYERVPALTNPALDAEAMRKLLDGLGFEVTMVTDRNARKLSRDLENFVTDAADEKADAAVIYYSGHGIEAGGEDYLVATDADPATAGSGLIAISETLDRLRQSIPVSIVLLDACRTNPFPLGFSLATAGGTVTPEGAGLGIPRGFAPAEGDSPQGIGMVIGFSASPGTAALDGDPGSNSPYTAALLRHLSAIGGNEFGQVMRMVTEEVYLKTQGRQRPWVNETLTKFLYFGGTPPAADDVTSRIDGERRPLLLMIADLPEARRNQVERLAKSEDVPLDTLFGVLRALGETDLPEDPESLDRLLREKAEQLREFAKQQEALASDDPELKRLAAAADRAQAEGALEAARGFLDEAKAHIAKTKGTIDKLETDIRAKRLANGAIYAKSAQAAALSFDYAGAAADYGEAYDWVKAADDLKAWEYLTDQAYWLSAHGEESGDPAALRTAVDLYNEALDLVPVGKHPDEWATTQNSLGSTLRRIGETQVDAQALQDAIAAYEAALTIRDRASAPNDWAASQMNLGNAYAALGQFTGNVEALTNAIRAYQAALDVFTREAAPDDWGTLQNNIGTGLIILADRTGHSEFYPDAIKAFEAALSVRDRDKVPLQWAETETNLGTALNSLGEKRRDKAMLKRAIAAFEAALSEFSRDQTPIRWARVENNLGNAWRILGTLEEGIESLEKALAALEAARQLRGRDTVPMQWALTTANIGNVLGLIGERRKDVASLEQSIAAYDAALEIFTPERAEAQWSFVSWEFTRVLLVHGKLAKSRASLEKGLAIAKALRAYDLGRGNDDPAEKARIAEFEKALRKLK